MDSLYGLDRSLLLSILVCLTCGLLFFWIRSLRTFSGLILLNTLASFVILRWLFVWFLAANVFVFGYSYLVARLTDKRSPDDPGRWRYSCLGICVLVAVF